MKIMELVFRATFENARMGTMLTAGIFDLYYAPDETGNTPTADMELAVGEACVNAVRHAGGGQGENPVVVRMRLGAAAFEVTVMDRNPPFDFDNVPEPDFDALPESGYGIHIMKETADRVRYLRKNGWNLVTLTRFMGISSIETDSRKTGPPGTDSMERRPAGIESTETMPSGTDSMRTRLSVQIP